MGKIKVKSSRRKFIKASGTIAGGLLTFFWINPTKGIAMISDEKGNSSGHWYGIGIDIEKCIGCGKCASACKDENDVPREPFYFRSWVEQYTVKKDGSIEVESPNGGIDGFEQSLKDEDIFKSFFVPKMCNHCYKSPCTQVCPVGATYDSPEGVVLIDEKHCIGCKYCVQACPYGCRYVHPEKKVVDKCTLCYHRIKKDLIPACFEVCPTGARIFGDLNDEDGALVKFVRENNCQILKAHLNTGSKLYYNSLSMEVR